MRDKQFCVRRPICDCSNQGGQMPEQTKPNTDH